MKISSQIIFCSLMGFFYSIHCCSQSPYIYNLPSTAHSLKLKKKGDLSFSIGAARTNGGSKYFLPNQIDFYRYKKHTTNLQLAYSPLNRLSISFNHDRIVTRDKVTSGQTFHNSQIFGVGIGTYHPFELQQLFYLKKGNKEPPQLRKMLFDLYLGYDKGEFSNLYFGSDSGDVNLNVRKYYIQCGLHYLGKRFELGYMLKFGQVNYLKGIINGTFEGPDRETVQSISNLSNFFIWESTVRLDIKIRQFILFSQITNTTNNTFHPDQSTTNIVHLGLTMKFQNLVFK